MKHKAAAGLVYLFGDFTPQFRLRTPTRIVGPSLVLNTATTNYTVPDQSIAVLKFIHVENPSGAPVDLTISIGADSAMTRLLDGLPIPGDSVYELPCQDSLDEGDIIQSLASTTNVLTLTISGEVWTA